MFQSEPSFTWLVHGRDLQAILNSDLEDLMSLAILQARRDVNRQVPRPFSASSKEGSTQRIEVCSIGYMGGCKPEDARKLFRAALYRKSTQILLAREIVELYELAAERGLLHRFSDARVGEDIGAHPAREAKFHGKAS